jgi:hypothetical protein
MNSERSLSPEPQIIVRYVLPALGCLAAIVLGLFLVSYPNTFTSLLVSLALAIMIAAVVNPAGGLYLLIGLSGYLDLVKRLGILTNDIQAFDVVMTLAVAPVLFASICGGVVVRRILERRPLQAWQQRLLVVVALMTAAVLLHALSGGAGVLGALQEFANSGAYLPLILVVGLLYPNPEELRRLVKFCLLIYVPVALYGIWQQIFGLSDFEVNYLKTGFTMNIGLLDDVRPRPFSTLNSPHALSVCTAMLSAAAWLIPWNDRHGRFWRIGLGTLYAAACAFTMARAGWVLLALAILSGFCFRSRILTAVFYGAIAITFAFLLTNADPLLKSLDYLESRLPADGDLQSQAFRLGTFSERLMSFRNDLTNPEFHTWFGNRNFQAVQSSDAEEADSVVHDQVGQILISYGFCGLAVLAGLLGAGLWFGHRAVHRQQDPVLRATLVGLLSVITATVYSGMLFGSHLSVFPVNIFFFLFAGFLVICSASRMADQAS